VSTRNADKARQAQLFMGIYKDMTSDEFPTKASEILSWTWTDFDDFQRKYGWDVNLENYVKRETVWNWFDGMGVLVRRNLIDGDLVYDKLNGPVSTQWQKWGDVILGLREKGVLGADSYAGFEYLAGEMVRIRRKKGVTWVPRFSPFQAR